MGTVTTGWALLACVLGPVVSAGTPRLVLRRIIGDVRGKGMTNLSVAQDDRGVTYLLMRCGRLAVFEPDGSYRYSRRLEPMRHRPHRFYLAASQDRVFLGNFPADFPWLCNPQHVGAAPGRFRNPRAAAMDPNGRVYVADTENRRVQVFGADNTHTPETVVPLPARPFAVTVRADLLAVLTDDRHVRLFRRTGGRFEACAAGRVGPAARSVALGPGGDVLVASGGGPDRHDLKRYRVRDRTIERAAVIAPSYMKQWPNLLVDPSPLVTGPDGHVWFTCRSRGCILSLDPATDGVRERERGLKRPTSLQFDPTGRLCVGVDGPRIVRVDPKADAAQRPQPFLTKGKLYKERGVPIWGLLPDRDGGIYVRVVEEGYRKGWPALAFKKVYPNGRMKPLLDFGSMYAVRTRFGPWAAMYALGFDGRGDLVLTALPLLAVLKTAPDGTVRWEAGLQPRGGADTVAFEGPCDLALDRRGNIWIADVRKHAVFCVSPTGRLLLEYGAYAGIDDRQGKGFHAPSGVAVAQSHGTELLYVADSGNQRLVKYEIVW